MLLALSLLACGDKDQSPEETGQTDDTELVGDDTGDTASVVCTLVDVSPKTIPADHETDVIVTTACGDSEGTETVTVDVAYSSEPLSRTTANGVDWTVAIHHHASTLKRGLEPLKLTKRIDKSTPHMLSDGVITALSEDRATLLQLKPDGSELGSRELASDNPCVTELGLCVAVPGGFVGFGGATAIDATMDEDFKDWVESYADVPLFRKITDVVPGSALVVDGKFNVLGVAKEGGEDIFWVVRADGGYTTARTVGGLSPQDVADGMGAVVLAPYDSATTGFDTGVVVSAFVIGGGGTEIVAHDFSVSNMDKTSGSQTGKVTVETGGSARSLVDGDDHVVVWEIDGGTVVLRRDAKRLGLDIAEVEMLRVSVGGEYVLGEGVATRIDGGGSVPIADPWSAPDEPALILGSEPLMWATASCLGDVPEQGDVWTVTTLDGESAGWGIEKDGGGAGVYAMDAYPDNMKHELREHITFTYLTVMPTSGQPLAQAIDEQALFVENENYFIAPPEGDETSVDLGLDVAIALVADGGWWVHGASGDAGQVCFVDTKGGTDCGEFDAGIGAPMTLAVGDFLGTGEDHVAWIGTTGTAIVTGDHQKNRRTEFSVLNFEHSPSNYVADVNGDGMDDVLLHDGLSQSRLLLSDGDGGWLDEEHGMDLTGLAWPGPVPGHAQDGDLVESTTMWGL